MSKKKKKKINKKIIQERLKSLQSIAGKGQEKTQKVEERKVKTKKEDVEVKKEDDYILSDMKKVFYVSLLVLLIFVVLILLNLKTNYLNEGSIWIFKALSVGQL